MATPWRPLGSPKRNSARMMPQSGRHCMSRENHTGVRCEKSSPMPTTPSSVLAMTAPIAAPFTPNAGIGPKPLISIRFSTMWTSVRARPRRSGVRASPAARSAPPSMKKSSMPRLPANMMRR